MVLSSLNCEEDEGNNYCQPAVDAEPAQCANDPCLDQVGCTDDGALSCSGNDVIVCEALDAEHDCLVEKVSELFVYMD